MKSCQNHLPPLAILVRGVQGIKPGNEWSQVGIKIMFAAPAVNWWGVTQS